MSATTILIIVGILAAVGLAGRLLKLFRQSDQIEKKLDYSKMREWKDDDD